ncbi:endonuclease/exonuclease/phosphatase family protein [Treponema sp. OMZ 840]
MKSIGIVITAVIGGLCFLFALMILALTLTEFNPDDTEAANSIYASDTEFEHNRSERLLASSENIRIVTWNIGYAGLGAKQDFFMDGGTMVRPPSKKAVQENLDGIVNTINRIDADVLLVQEIDLRSRRSFYIDQAAVILQHCRLPGVYTCNFRCFFVPFPFPPIGRVVSGLATFSQFSAKSALRYALPVPFKWPVRIANLKRCLLVSRFPLASGKELVLVNLHLEAYDEGEGKIAQTKALTDFLIAEYAKGNFIVAGGDFNQTFPGLDLSAYPAVAGVWQAAVMDASILPEGWRFAADDKAPSCRLNNGIYAQALADENLRKNWQYYIIDGFIVSPNVEVKSVRTLNENFMYADHNPVEIEVSLRAQKR